MSHYEFVYQIDALKNCVEKCILHRMFIYQNYNIKILTKHGECGS